MNVINFNQSAGAQIVRAADRKPATKSSLEHLSGRFQVEHIRNGEVIGTYEFPNGITNEGKNRLFNVMFNSGTQITTWYLGLIDNANYSALANGDTYDDIDQVGNGWDEFKAYTDADNADSTTTRPVWPVGSASGQSITNSTQAIFNITSGGTVKGVFVCGGTDAQTKGDHTTGTANVLWSTALFSQGDTPVVNGDQLKVTYSVSA